MSKGVTRLLIVRDSWSCAMRHSIRTVPARLRCVVGSCLTGHSAAVALIVRCVEADQCKNDSESDGSELQRTPSSWTTSSNHPAQLSNKRTLDTICPLAPRGQQYTRRWMLHASVVTTASRLQCFGCRLDTALHRVSVKRKFCGLDYVVAYLNW